MKRHLSFNYYSGKYVLEENEEIIFEIDSKDLKFDSLDFYNRVYKGKTAAIQLTNEIVDDPIKKGQYIFCWLLEIITSIQAEIQDPELEDTDDGTEEMHIQKKVWLFDFAACAGDGFYIDGEGLGDREIDCDNPNASYAVRIVGDSMEPTISNGSIVFVQKVDTLDDKDIGIFVVDGTVMCKRYREVNGKKWLQPDNDLEYAPVYFKQDTNCIIQGRVLLST